MLIKGIQEEDFTNYKKTSMFIIFPFCTFKCDKEAGCSICQNSSLVKIDPKRVNTDTIIEHYVNNPITHAIVLGGLEPIESFEEVIELISKLREQSDDEVVIYTGFNKEEIIDKIEILKQYKNIIIKFGRFKYGEEPHYDEVLGINLASSNQYAEKIS